jgi:hypothetical protein
MALPLAAAAADAPGPKGVSSTNHGADFKTAVLGTSTVELTWPWRFHTGDNMAWVQPGFDDSTWDAMDLTLPQGSKDPYLGSTGFVPGWTMRGYAGYTGYAWYRMRVNVQENDANSSKSDLALKMPVDVDDAYQVYVNGQLVGDFGRFSAHGVTSYLTLPRAFTLPANLSTGPMTIAIRVWMDPATPMSNPDTGGLHGPVLLGQAAPVLAMLHMDWDAVDHGQASRILETGILLLGTLVALVLYLLDRREKAYFWLGTACAVSVVQAIVLLIANYTTWIQATPEMFLLDVLLRPALIGLWVLFWAYWFRLGRMARLRKMIVVMTVLLAVSMAMLRAPLFGRAVPVRYELLLSPLSLLFKLLLGALLVWVTWEGMRRDNTGGWLALPAVALVALSLYQEDMLLSHLPLNFFPFGFAVSINQIAVVLSLCIITVLLMRRFLRSLREREQWQLEIDQARQVQQLLIPEAIPSIPGFAIESEYRPATEVGGDFFQILPDKVGGVLIVLGDVTGKGLQAGMLVALIVGAIRTIVETSYEPQYVLQTLNRRLRDRAQAAATCVAMHVEASGTTTIVNAGHLAPYFNGKELAVENNLPLGLTDALQLEETRVTLQPLDRLIVLTDGVIEARNDQKELFGFNRARSISHLPASFIARAAQIFGQDDDITVLSISREGSGKHVAMAPKTKPLSTQVAKA